jgi:C1A family cysteine protease
VLEKALSDGFPFRFVTRIYDGASFSDEQIDANGVFKIPANLRDLKDDGGHALMAVRFDTSNKRFLIQNSWGKEWSEKVPASGRGGIAGFHMNGLRP